ncbi:MAG: cytochrome d ubiquinol oxidase subunit II [Rhabdochlamydiaceae bacterium]|nr:cytochrome d ubiquinol oxidase subunit II [Rhabdochlamydiaceae bacterium]
MIGESNYALIWYLIVGVAAIMYVILDGFDLGVGMLHPFAKKDQERRIFLNAIGPVWDGNEVWLVIVGGALFAGFPDVYAALFSGFYNLCMLLLCGLIFRAVAIEFRSKRPSKQWRSTWDWVFSISSYIIAFGIGLALGNMIEGVPLNEHKDFVGSFSLFFRPYPILIGFLSCALLMMHGAIFLCMKTEHSLHERLRSWVNRTVVLFIIVYVIATIVTWMQMPHMVAKMMLQPYLLVFGLLAILSFLNVPREFSLKRDFRAFVYSSMGIMFLFILYGIGTFPTLIRSTLNGENYSLTFYNSASSPLTLKILLVIVAIGVPLVLAYGFYIYRVFKGKVKIGPSSY